MLDGTLPRQLSLRASPKGEFGSQKIRKCQLISRPQREQTSECRSTSQCSIPSCDKNYALALPYKPHWGAIIDRMLIAFPMTKSLPLLMKEEVFSVWLRQA